MVDLTATRQRLTIEHVATDPDEEIGEAWVCSTYNIMLGGKLAGTIQHTPHDALFFPVGAPPVKLWNAR